MAASNAPVDICNKALDFLHVEPISSIDAPETTEEEICARHYDDTRREVLRAFVFNVSNGFATLTEDTGFGTLPQGYTKAFALPNESIRVLRINGVDFSSPLRSHFYDIFGRHIVTRSVVGITDLNIEYIKDLTSVTIMDPLLIKLIALTLAMNIAYKFTLKNSVVDRVEKLLEKFELRAAAIDGQERPPRRIQRSKFLNSRRRLSNVAGPFTITG